MDDKILNLCKKYATVENISLQDYYGSFGCTTRCNSDEYNRNITINTFYPFHEQVYTLMHEIMHWHPLFIHYTLHAEKRKERIENKIDKIAKHIVDTRSDIKKLLEDILIKTEKYQKDVEDEYRNEKVEEYQDGDLPF